jgi:hypothetical protein
MTSTILLNLNIEKDVSSNDNNLESTNPYSTDYESGSDWDSEYEHEVGDKDKNKSTRRVYRQVIRTMYEDMDAVRMVRLEINPMRKDACIRSNINYYEDLIKHCTMYNYKSGHRKELLTYLLAFWSGLLHTMDKNANFQSHLVTMNEDIDTAKFLRDSQRFRRRLTSNYTSATDADLKTEREKLTQPSRNLTNCL